jgi:hypothetical protein
MPIVIFPAKTLNSSANACPRIGRHSAARASDRWRGARTSAPGPRSAARAIFAWRDTAERTTAERTTAERTAAKRTTAERTTRDPDA